MEHIQDILQVQGVNAKGYGIVGKIAMQDPRLTIEAKAIYAYFRSFAGAGTTAFPGVEKILADLRISEKRYYKHLKFLKEYDYIRVSQEVKKNGTFSRNIYTLIDNPNPVEYTNSTYSSKLPEPFRQNDSTVDNSPTNQNDSTVPTSQNDSTVPSSRFDGININRKSFKNIAFNNLSINPYIDKAFKLRPTKKDRSKNNNQNLSTTLNSNKDFHEDKLNKFTDLIQGLQLEHLNEVKGIAIDPLVVVQALRLLYFRVSPLKVGEMRIPASQVRKDLEKLSFDMIVQAFFDMENIAKRKQIQYPAACLSICIYNAIWNASTMAQTQAVYDLENGLV